MAKWLLLISLTSMLLFNSCKDSASPYIGDEQILPLAIGNTWIYNSIHYDRQYPDTSIVMIDSTTVEMKITKVDSIDKFTGYYIQNLIFPLWNVDYILFNYDSNGLYAIYKNLAGPVIIPPPPPPPPHVETVIPYPGIIGGKTNFDGYDIALRSVSEKVTVPAGTFYSNLYEVYTDTSVVAKIWAVPNVGIIKMWTQMFSDYEVYELLSYSVH